ncbi:hypothetical protein B0J14DRAFT_581313 [Halenospora varia]|nr:hypothetical protein B0J14DRAFT_581313 [Halenospora varia]
MPTFTQGLCLYKALGLKRKDNPQQSQIKRAYRTKALQWHPDKNPDNPKRVTELFKIVRRQLPTLGVNKLI